MSLQWCKRALHIAGETINFESGTQCLNAFVVSSKEQSEQLDLVLLDGCWQVLCHQFYTKH